MTAADRREELEAKLHRLGIPVPGVIVVLALADKYAQACADDAWHAAIGQQRLAAARAEHSPATMPGART